MNQPATDVSAPAQYPDSLARADAREREITDLYAQINAASYRLLQLIATMAAQHSDENNTAADDVTAVTLKCENHSAQRRADALMACRTSISRLAACYRFKQGRQVTSRGQREPIREVTLQSLPA